MGIERFVTSAAVGHNARNRDGWSAARAVALSRGGLVMYHTPEVPGALLMIMFQTRGGLVF